jgi:ADP-ribosyl-[dinitrogen reductase] hydrolase
VDDISILERIAGAMLGLACGDALGAPAEFRSRSFIAQKWGRLTDMTGGGIWDPGEWTDDTGMALCIAEGILERPDAPVEPVGARFIAWSKDAKDVGDTIASVIESYAGDWAKASRMSPAGRAGRAVGNGSLMRTLPVALAYPNTWEMLTISASLSAMTHWDAQAELACAVYCLWIDGILNGKPMREAYFDAIDAAKKVADHGPLAPDTPGPALGAASDTSNVFDLSDDEPRSPKPHPFWQRLANVENVSYDDLQPTGYAGYVLDCLEAAAWCCLKAEDAEVAIELAVNLGGESDTIGAVAGGVAGAYWGLAALPPRWIAALIDRDRIVDIAKQLDELRRHNVVYATPGLPTFEYYRVAENLHAGRAPLTARDVRTLAALGVTHFLDLRSEDEWRAPGRLGTEAVAMIDELGLRRTVFPVVEPTAERAEPPLDDIYEFLTSTMAKPEAHVYVHGQSGRGRTAAVLVAYLAAESMMTYDEVLVHLSDQLMKSSGVRIDPGEALGDCVREWLRRRG